VPGVNIVTSSTTALFVPFTSAANAAVAQQAVTRINSAVIAGVLQPVDWAGGSGVLPEPVDPAIIAGGVVTVGGGSNLGLMPSSYYALVDDSSGIVAAIGGPNTTVVSGSLGTLIYQNIASSAEIYLGGGNNLIKEAFASSAAVINVDAGVSNALGSGHTIIDASLGSSTINVFANALIDVIAGGTALVIAQPGSVVVGVTGPSTNPVTVEGGANTDLVYIPDGGSSFINPGAGNVVVIAGSGGSETVFGGSMTIGGVPMTADAFTGTATVFAGTGYFQGGSAGGNNMQTSTLPGAATLVGGGNGDVLNANAPGDLLIAGPGNAVLFAAQTTSQGDTFITGSGATTVLGAAGGNNTIELGSGTSTVYGQHNTGGSGSVSGNRYLIEAAGGTHMIADYLPGFDVLDFADSVGHPSLLTVTFFASATDSPFGQPGSQAILSDGTTINFPNESLFLTGST